MNKLTIYTDGAYSPSNDQGGIGFVIAQEGKRLFSYSKMFRHTTNQRMEIIAVCIALESIKDDSEIEIVTDSMYVVGTMSKNWKRNANNDLWERLEVAASRHKVTYTWCKGHANNEFNELADTLAFDASKQLPSSNLVGGGV